MGKLITIRINEFFKKQIHKIKTDVKLKEILNFSYDGIDIDGICDDVKWNLEFSFEDLQKATIDTGVDFFKIDKDRIFKILLRSELEYLDDILTSQDHPENSTAETFFDNINYAKRTEKIEEIYIGDGKHYFIKSEDFESGNREKVFEFIDGKMEPAKKKITNKIIDKFNHLFVFATDEFDIDLVEFKQKLLLELEIDNEKRLDRIIYDHINNFCLNIEEFATEDINWEWVLEQLEIQKLYEEEVLAA